jgi:hypothetical protein
MELLVKIQQITIIPVIKDRLPEIRMPRERVLLIRLRMFRATTERFQTIMIRTVHKTEVL